MAKAAVPAFDIDRDTLIDKVLDSALAREIVAELTSEMLEARRQARQTIAESSAAIESEERRLGAAVARAREAVIPARRALRDALDIAGRAEKQRRSTLVQLHKQVEDARRILRAMQPASLRRARMALAAELRSLEAMPRRTPEQRTRLVSLRDESQYLDQLDQLDEATIDKVTGGSDERLLRRTRRYRAINRLRDWRPDPGTSQPWLARNSERRVDTQTSAVRRAIAMVTALDPADPEFDTKFKAATKPVAFVGGL